jgi:hypothetical protein
METTGPGSKLSYTPSTLEGAMALADILAKSKVGIPDTLQGKPAEILTVVMQGAELGLTPLRSLNQIHVIKGRTTLAAQLMSAMVKSHPLCKYLRLKQEIKDGAGHVVGVEYETHREGDPGPVVMSFTLQDASQMGLLNKDNWKKQPVTMMRARGISRICREVYPDLIGGMYAKEEIQDNVLDTEPPVVVDAEVVAGTKSDKVAAAIAATSSTVEAPEPEVVPEVVTVEEPTTAEPVDEEREALALEPLSKDAIAAICAAATERGVFVDLNDYCVATFGTSLDETPADHYDAIMAWIHAD